MKKSSGWQGLDKRGKGSCLMGRLSDWQDEETYGNLSYNRVDIFNTGEFYTSKDV
jgi:hypothetical protein